MVTWSVDHAPVGRLCSIDGIAAPYFVVLEARIRLAS